MKNKILIQALILGAGAIGGKILSLIFLFKFARDIKPIGLYLYTYAYIPFSLFLDLSAFGLIPGVSKCVSKMLGNNENKKVTHLLRRGTLFSLIIGVLFFVLINVFNDKILAVSLYEGYTIEEYNIILEHLKIASLSLLVFPLISFYKGFIQGHMRMLPSAMAILLENLVRILLYLYISKEVSIELIKSVFLINFISYVSALALLFLFVVKDYLKPSEKYSAIYNILKVSMPFGTVTMFFTFFQLIDSITLSSLGIDSHIYTAYMFETIRLIFIPIVFSQSVGGALNPKINMLCSTNKHSEARRLAIRLTSLMIYLLVPIVVIYKMYSKEIYTFFYDNEQLFLILNNISLLIFFIGFYKVIIGISQGLNKFKYVVISTFISGLAKTVLNIILVPTYDYMGAILSTIIAITICMMISYYVLHMAKMPLLIKNLKAIIISVISCGLSIYVATIFRLVFLINTFSLLMEGILFCLIMILIYSLILSFISIIKVSKKTVAS